MQQLQAAVSLHNQGELGKAEKIYRDVLAVDANNPYALRFLGCICRVQGLFDQGLELFMKAIQLVPHDADCWFNLGNIYMDACLHENAIQSFEKALEFRPEFPEVLINLGHSLFELGLFEESRNALQKGLSMSEACAQGWVNLGNALNALEMPEKAIESYRKAINYDPTLVQAYLNLGHVFKGQVLVEESIASYRKAILVNPGCAGAHLHLGNVLKQEGEVEEAIVCYKRAIMVQPDNETAIECLASALIALERRVEAHDVIRSHTSSSIQGSFPHFLCFLASGSDDSYLNVIDLGDSLCIDKLKYSLLRKLRSWICVGDWLEAVYDFLYGELYAVFGIQGLDTTSDIYMLKPLEGWSLPRLASLTLSVYSSRFSLGGDRLELSAPFSSDINHLSCVGHFYLILSARFRGKVDMVGRRIEIRLDYGIDALPAGNLCLGFSARVGADWGYDERSHSYVEMTVKANGLFSADVIPERLKELGINEKHFTAKKYKLCDPVVSAQHATGIFLFLRSPDYPVNPKGSVSIYGINVMRGWR